MKTVNKSPRGHPLYEWVSFEQESIQKFKDSYPELWKVFGDSINLARAVPFVIGRQDELTEIEMHRLFLWQKILHYQVQSLFLVVQHQLDAGYALLRLAAELSRDLACIADDEKMLSIWLARENKQNEYKKHFKFSLDSPDGRVVYNVYKFASKFGVHGHLTDAIFSKVIGTIGKNNSMLSFGVSDYGVIEAVYMWMLLFLPIHYLCAKTFISKYSTVRPDLFATLEQHGVAMNNMLQKVSALLENLKMSEK